MEILQYPGRDRAMDAIDAVAQQLGSIDEDPDAFYQRLSANVAGLVGAGRIAFFVLEGDQLRLVEPAFGIAPKQASALRRLPCHRAGGQLLDAVVFGGRGVRLQLPNLDPRLKSYRRPLRQLDATDAMFVPWAAADNVLGLVAAFDSGAANGFSSEDERVLSIMAASAALIARQRDLAQATLDAKSQAHEDIESVAGRASELEEMKRRFLNLAAHELRGPIAIVRGYVSMLAENRIDGPTLRRILPVLTGKTAQMDAIVTQMLEIARLEEGRLSLNRETLDLGKVARASVDVSALLAPPGLSVFLKLSPHPVVVDGDRERLSGIVSNLVDNAMKYSPNGGTVLCSVGLEGDRAYVSVKDEGLGIAAADLPILFTRFGRIVTPENSHISGTGLGLSLSRELARLHGGDISVQSESGRGSTFTLWLPARTTASTRASRAAAQNN